MTARPNDRYSLRALRRHSGGNVLAIAAASIFPILAIVGGTVEMSRAYMAQAQLQSACDAGVLAGRRPRGRPQHPFDDVPFPRGHGGADLYRSRFERPAGTEQIEILKPGAPKNLGPEINSAADETAPALRMAGSAARVNATAVRTFDSIMCSHAAHGSACRR